MATYTTNLNLKKPAQSDKIRIADINNNMDDIDAAFGAIGNDSVATQIGDIQDALAIVAVGDSHAAITAGQYVYVKSHETLDTGLYVASANIAQNGALSSSNLTADTAGGLNALNSKITNKIEKVTCHPIAAVTIGAGNWADIETDIAIPAGYISHICIFLYNLGLVSVNEWTGNGHLCVSARNITNDSITLQTTAVLTLIVFK